MGIPDDAGWFYLQEDNNAWVRRFLKLSRGFLYAYATEDPGSEVICSLKLTDSLIDYCPGDGSTDGSAYMVVTISPICHIVYQNPRRSTSISADTDCELRSWYQAVRRVLSKDTTKEKDRPLMPVQRALLKSQTATVGAPKTSTTLRQLFSEPLPPPPQQQSWQGLDACDSRKESNILFSLKTSSALLPSSKTAHPSANATGVTSAVLTAKPSADRPLAANHGAVLHSTGGTLTDAYSHQRGRKEVRSTLTVTGGARGLGSTDESAAITVKLQEKARQSAQALVPDRMLNRNRSLVGKSARSAGLAATNAAPLKRGTSQPRNGLSARMRTVH